MFVHLQRPPKSEAQIKAALSQRYAEEALGQEVEKEMRQQDEALEREADRMAKEAKAEFKEKYDGDGSKEYNGKV